MQRNLFLSMIVVFAASSAALTLLHVMFPFPLLPFLEFDMAEIPDTIAFLVLGPRGGLLVALIHCLLLYVLGAFTVFSPLMKLFAEGSMFIGLYMAYKISRGWRAATALGIFFRAFIMLFVTLALYYIIMPGIYLPTARLAMKILGISLVSPLAIALLLVGITTLFNVIAGLITLGVSFGIYRTLRSAFKGLDFFFP